MTDGWAATLAWFDAPMLPANIYVAPVLAVVQNHASADRRAVASAVLVLKIVLIGLGGGSLFLGVVSEFAKPGRGEAFLVIGYAALVPAVLAAIALYLLAARAMRSGGPA